MTSVERSRSDSVANRGFVTRRYVMAKKKKKEKEKNPKNKKCTVDNTVKSLPAGFFSLSFLKCRERQRLQRVGYSFMVTRGEPLRSPSTEASVTTVAVEQSMRKSDAKNAGDFVHTPQQLPGFSSPISPAMA